MSQAELDNEDLNFNFTNLHMNRISAFFSHYCKVVFLF